MTPKLQNTNRETNTSNNSRLGKLVADSGLTQPQVLLLLNAKQAKAISLSGLQAWLATPGAVRWRPVSDSYIAHAEKCLKVAKKST